jgi:hypothetical protein
MNQKHLFWARAQAEAVSFCPQHGNAIVPQKVLAQPRGTLPWTGLTGALLDIISEGRLNEPAFGRVRFAWHNIQDSA